MFVWFDNIAWLCLFMTDQFLCLIHYTILPIISKKNLT